MEFAARQLLGSALSSGEKVYGVRCIESHMNRTLCIVHRAREGEKGASVFANTCGVSLDFVDKQPSWFAKRNAVNF